MTTLVDPHVLVEASPLSESASEKFWLRILSISKARHLEVGHEGFHWIIGKLAEMGYPAQRITFGPEDFGRECQSAIESILSRVSRGSASVEEADFSPAYTAGVDVAVTLMMDISEHRDTIHSILSDHSHWAEPTESINLGNLRRVELLVDPEQEPTAHHDQDIRDWYSAKRIHILGGSPSPHQLSAISTALGVTQDQIFWIESEASKPPRNLDKAWGSLNPERDVAVCNTARIGHKSWEKADKTASGCGVIMLECHGHGKIVPALQELALKDIQAEHVTTASEV